MNRHPEGRKIPITAQTKPYPEGGMEINSETFLTFWSNSSKKKKKEFSTFSHPHRGKIQQAHVEFRAFFLEIKTWVCGLLVRWWGGGRERRVEEAWRLDHSKFQPPPLRPFPFKNPFF